MAIISEPVSGEPQSKNLSLFKIFRHLISIADSQVKRFCPEFEARPVDPSDGKNDEKIFTTL